MLKADKITYGFEKDDLVVEKLTLSVKPGEIISIVGSSGVGKTTLLKCLSGKLQLLEGKVWVDEELLPGPLDKLIAGHDEVAIVDQDFSLDHYFTVEENIGNRLLHLSIYDREAFTTELLTVFGLNELKNQPSKFISGGEKQRLSMACALAKEPKYLLLDEPFSNLDVHLKKSIGNYLRKLQEIRNMGVVLVTHEGVDALAWSDKIYFFKHKGKLHKYTPEKAYYSPRTLHEGRFFGQLNSVYIDGQQVLFRPTQYGIEKGEFKRELAVKYLTTEFHGHFYANYFKLAKGKEIVLYAQKELNQLNKIYV